MAIMQVLKLAYPLLHCNQHSRLDQTAVHIHLNFQQRAIGALL